MIAAKSLVDTPLSCHSYNKALNKHLPISMYSNIYYGFVSITVTDPVVPLFHCTTTEFVP